MDSIDRRQSIGQSRRGEDPTDSADFLENCLKILENFLWTLVRTDEAARGALGGLGRVCRGLAAIRWRLAAASRAGECAGGAHRGALVEAARAIVGRLQGALGLATPLHAHALLQCRRGWHEQQSQDAGETPKTPGRSGSSAAKYNICRRKKTKKKTRSIRRGQDCVAVVAGDQSRTIMSRLHGNVVGGSRDDGNRRAIRMQQIIDQMYTQIRTVLSENCIDDVDLFKELNASMKEDCLNRIIIETNRLQPINQQAKYQEHLSSGDCKVIEDSKDIFSNQFDKLLALDNLDMDAASLSERILSTSSKNRYRKDSELDEGFSENEFLNVDNKLDGNESSKLSCYEQFSYCGDCHYNSSNSKSDENISPDMYTIPKYTPVEHLDDGSDSDGGTELLNSVNDTVNKFNAIMQCTLNTNGSTTIEKSPNFSMNSLEPSSIDNQLPLRYQPIFDNRSTDDGHLSTSLPKKSFYKNDLLPIEPNPTVSLLSNPVAYKEDRYESTILSVNNFQHSSSVSSLSNLNYDNVSKMLVSPVSVQNWCSYNFSQISSPSCNVNYRTKPSVNIDTNNNPNSDSYCSGKLSSWLPPISHGLISTNSYVIGSNSHQPPFHRIMLTPHLSIPSTNMGHMQHNIVHLPQIFQQLPHSLIDTDFYDRRQIQMNLQNQFSNPNNNNSSSDNSVPSSANLIANSNCSNITISSNLHQSISIIKSSLNKSQRACCFYMRGGCKKEDCEYAHDLSKVTCKFWEKGDCFKADTCPFKHGYTKA